MALGTESKKSILRYKDLFIADFWRYLLKAGWLYFPSILFLIIAYGSQTTVNDQRLKNFFHSMYNKPDFLPILTSTRMPVISGSAMNTQSR